MESNLFRSLQSYGKWDPTTKELLSDAEKQKIDRIVVIDGQYGPTACFFLKDSSQVKMITMDDSCNVPIGARLDVNSIVLQHYTDGDFVATRCIAKVI